MLRGKLQSELFYCNHLGVSDKDEQDIMNFTIRDEKGAGLISYNEHDVPVVDEITGEEVVEEETGEKKMRRVFDTLPVVREAAETIGIKILYLFALPYEDLIDRYKTYGFSRLEKELEEELHKRLKPLYDDDCKFMYRML